jgi:hypothetical protein
MFGVGQLESILLQGLTKCCLEVEKEHFQPVTSLKATEEVSDQLSGTTGSERLPFLVPWASEDVLQSSQSSHGDQVFHLVGVHNDTKHLKNGADAHFFQFVPCYGCCGERGFYGVRETCSQL